MIKAPENTITSYRKAIEAGFKGTELDVVATRDNKLVCTHNIELGKKTDGYGKIYELDYDQIKDYLVQTGAKDAEPEGIPLFEDALSIFPDDFRINIEVKVRSVWDYKTTLLVSRLVRDRGLQDRIIISSFNPFVLMLVKLIDNSILTGLLVDPELGSSLFLINLVHPDCLHPAVNMVDDDLIRFARHKGMAINVWTVNNRPAIDWLIDRGVDGIISDRPEYCGL